MQYLLLLVSVRDQAGLPKYHHGSILQREFQRACWRAVAGRFR